MANMKFTARLNAAIKELAAKTPQLREPRSRSLFTPVYRNGRFEWVKIMDSDGILLAERRVENGEGGAIDPETMILVGAVIQSEDSTSRTKPNPMGKAAIAHVPNGVWVTTAENVRRRVDMLTVVFLLPEGAAPAHQRSFATARRNVINAAEIMPDAIAVEVPRGISASQLGDVLAKSVRRFLVGKGRPRIAP